MGTKYLLDTNTVIDFMGSKLPEKARKKLAKIIDIEINISVINKIELLSFTKVDQDLIDFISYSNIYPLDESITELTIELRRKYKVKLPDAIIAATAIANNFTINTHNIKDFRKVDDLVVLNSYDIR
jgi:predicted nucleic acid-binding protein